jgi:4-amino-4-deoxy-L-arabinose transferase-like glycosyltransferase
VRRRSSLVETAAFLLVLAGALTYVIAHVPPAGGYQMAADEGIYYHQASAIVQAGPRAFAALANIYVGNEALQGGPSPLRIGHLVPAALVLRLNPSIVSLSILSVTCHALLCLAVFLFGQRLWDGRTAAVAGIFTAVSPLGWGLATRALLDTDHALFSALAIFMFILWLSSGRERHFAVFAAVLWWCLLVKETAWVYVPFAAGAMLVLKLAGRDGIRPRHVLIIGLAVPAAAGLVYALAFGGIGQALAVIEAVQRANVARPTEYLVATGSGPWYEYLVDFVLLSPPVAILFLMFCGRFVATPRRDLATAIVLVFIGYAVACLSLVPKNPRFALPLDPLLRMCAAAMVVATAAELRTSARARAAILIALVMLVVVSDARAFRRYFVTNGIYDPVAVNLLAAEKFLPTPSR